jgi:magnesium-transporting ATPase (P-type)
VGAVSQGPALSNVSVPTNLKSELEEYTQKGYRVLALAYKELPGVNNVAVQDFSREYVESSLIFLGLIIMENRLKPETTDTIGMLRNASIRTIMVTGEFGHRCDTDGHRVIAQAVSCWLDTTAA